MLEGQGTTFEAHQVLGGGVLLWRPAGATCWVLGGRMLLWRVAGLDEPLGECQEG